MQETVMQETALEETVQLVMLPAIAVLDGIVHHIPAQDLLEETVQPMVTGVLVV